METSDRKDRDIAELVDQSHRADKLAWRTDLTEQEAAFSVRTLRLMGTREAQGLLDGYLHEMRAAVLAELLQAVNPLRTLYVQQKMQAGEWEQIGSEVRENINPASLEDPLVRDFLSRLQSLVLRGTNVNDLSPLQYLPHLQALDLSFASIRRMSPEGLSPLRYLTQLKTLDLSFAFVADVSPLQHLRQLQTLDLSRTRVRDISPLQHLTRLYALDLRTTPVSDVSPLQHLSQLQKLDLSNTNVSDLSPLRNLTQLQTLCLNNTPVSDVSPLQYLPQLQALYLINTQVTDVSPLREMGVTVIQQLPAGEEGGSRVANSDGDE